MGNGCCGSGCKCAGIVILLAGVLFLLRDLNVWDFWNIQWWTVAFIVIGIGCSVGCVCHRGESCECVAPAQKKKK